MLQLHLVDQVLQLVLVHRFAQVLLELLADQVGQADHHYHVGQAALVDLEILVVQ